MPAMPRIKGLVTKIAYNITGKPDNISNKRSKKQEAIDKQLDSQETSRVK